MNNVRSEAEFEIEVERGITKRKFKAEIEHAIPGSEHIVKVGDLVVGSITADAKGKGKLILSSSPKGTSESLLPSDFPTITESTVVAIGDASGTFKKVL